MAQDSQTGYRAVRRRAPISERPAAGSRDPRVFSHCANSEVTSMSVIHEGVSARVCAGLDWAKDDHVVWTCQMVCVNTSMEVSSDDDGCYGIE